MIGTTDESGVTLPPLHPRCRCAIVYREAAIEAPNLTQQHQKLTQESSQHRQKYQELSNAIQSEKDEKRREKLISDQERELKALWQTEKNLRSIRLKAAKKNVILTTGLSREYDAQDVAKIVEAVRLAPQNIKTLWNLAEAEMKILDKAYTKIPHYDALERGIKLDLSQENFSKPPFRTTFHELGHLLDHFMGKRMYFYSKGYQGAIFQQTLREESQNALKETLARLKREALEGGKSPKAIKMSDAQTALSKELQRLEPATRREVADIFSGATKNKVKGGYYHENKYWNDDEYALGKEGFAHMFCATVSNVESLSLIQKYFPKSYGIFEQMIEAYLKEELSKSWMNLQDFRKNMSNVLEMFCLQNKCHSEIFCV